MTSQPKGQAINIKQQSKYPVTSRSKGRSINFKQRLLGVTLLMPAAILIIFTMLIPIIWNFVLSFADWSPLSGLKIVGLANYSQLIHDSITLKGFGYSIFIAVISSVIAILGGLVLALMVYKISDKQGSVFRLIFFTPSMMPFVVIGLLFTFILSPDGLINQFLKIIGLGSLGQAWLAKPGLVLWTLAVVSGWKGTGSVMMLFYTAIVTIPASMFEAARLEGANYFRQIQMIILPLIKPTIGLVSMLVIIGAFKAYDFVYTMTKGGPGDYSKIVPIQMLDVGFRFNQFGYAATIGVVFTILVAIIIFISQKLSKGDVYEY
ncbi:sugar ABC transporter permease [Neobacillus drentensis]|uniref:carbohydrate ABC transporter permease n=1 Tax=Neobacillus drentensis TaxID=220684 RepID=UPI001F427F02|nr:sugar ABC transporter permease [Neobacillus drentensis]ULT54894.1 sugar ABC transporter permease [Neobacillus drentensis]